MSERTMYGGSYAGYTSSVSQEQLIALRHDLEEAEVGIDLNTPYTVHGTTDGTTQIGTKITDDYIQNTTISTSKLNLGGTDADKYFAQDNSFKKVDFTQLSGVLEPISQISNTTIPVSKLNATNFVPGQILSSDGTWVPAYSGADVGINVAGTFNLHGTDGVPNQISTKLTDAYVSATADIAQSKIKDLVSNLSDKVAKTDIDASTNLGILDNKVPSQNAVKVYADAIKTYSNSTFIPLLNSNIVDAQVATSANIAQSKIQGLTTDLSSKIPKSDLSTDTSLGTSLTLVPCQNATKTYVDNQFPITIAKMTTTETDKYLYASNSSVLSWKQLPAFTANSGFHLIWCPTPNNITENANLGCNGSDIYLYTNNAQISVDQIKSQNYTFIKLKNAIQPDTNNTLDLGTGSFYFRNAYLHDINAFTTSLPNISAIKLGTGTLDQVPVFTTAGSQLVWSQLKNAMFPDNEIALAKITDGGIAGGDAAYYFLAPDHAYHDIRLISFYDPMVLQGINDGTYDALQLTSANYPDTYLKLGVSTDWNGLYNFSFISFDEKVAVRYLDRNYGGGPDTDYGIVICNTMNTSMQQRILNKFDYYDNDGDYRTSIYLYGCRWLYPGDEIGRIRMINDDEGNHINSEFTQNFVLNENLDCIDLSFDTSNGQVLFLNAKNPVDGEPEVNIPTALRINGYLINKFNGTTDEYLARDGQFRTITTGSSLPTIVANKYLHTTSGSVVEWNSIPYADITIGNGDIPQAKINNLTTDIARITTLENKKITNTDVDNNANIAQSKISGLTTDIGRIATLEAKKITNTDVDNNANIAQSKISGLTTDIARITTLENKKITNTDVDNNANIAQSKISGLTTDIGRIATLEAKKIVDADVDNSANIAQSKIAGLTTDIGRITTLEAKKITNTDVDNNANIAQSKISGLTTDIGRIATLESKKIFDADIDSSAAIQQSKILDLTSALGDKMTTSAYYIVDHTYYVPKSVYDADIALKLDTSQFNAEKTGFEQTANLAGDIGSYLTSHQITGATLGTVAISKIDNESTHDKFLHTNATTGIIEWASDYGATAFSGLTGQIDGTTQIANNAIPIGKLNHVGYTDKLLAIDNNGDIVWSSPSLASGSISRQYFSSVATLATVQCYCSAILAVAMKLSAQTIVRYYDYNNSSDYTYDPLKSQFVSGQLQLYNSGQSTDPDGANNPNIFPESMWLDSATTSTFFKCYYGRNLGTRSGYSANSTNMCLHSGNYKFNTIYNNGQTEYLEIDFVNNTRAINKYKVWFYQGSTTYANAWYLQGSLDGISYSTLHTQTTIPSITATLCTFSNITSYRFYRFVMTNLNESASCFFPYVELYGIQTASLFRNLFAANNYDPNSYSSNAISNANVSSREPYRAFRSITYLPDEYQLSYGDTNYWSSTSTSGNDYIGYHFEDNVPRRADWYYCMISFNFGVNYSFKLQGSNDGTTWTEMETSGHDVGYGRELQVVSEWNAIKFPITNKGYYSYHRILFYNKASATSVWCHSFGLTNDVVSNNYITNTPSTVITTNASQIKIGQNVSSTLTCVANGFDNGTTSIQKFLISTDQRLTWKYWNGSAWASSLITDIATNGMSTTNFQTYMNSNFVVVADQTIDIAVYQITTNQFLTPALNYISLTYTGQEYKESLVNTDYSCIYYNNDQNQQIQIKNMTGLTQDIMVVAAGSTSAQIAAPADFLNSRMVWGSDSMKVGIETKITTEYIDSNSINGDRLLDTSISSVKLASVPTTKLSGQIITNQITDLNITSDKLAANSVISSKINASAITNSHISDVDGSKIAGGSIYLSKLSTTGWTNNSDLFLNANAQWTTPYLNLNDNSVSNAKLTTTDHLRCVKMSDPNGLWYDGKITTYNFNTGTISPEILTGGLAYNYLFTSPLTGKPVWGIPPIQDGSITYSKLSIANSLPLTAFDTNLQNTLICHGSSHWDVLINQTQISGYTIQPSMQNYHIILPSGKDTLFCMGDYSINMRADTILFATGTGSTWTSITPGDPWMDASSTEKIKDNIRIKSIENENYLDRLSKLDIFTYTHKEKTDGFLKMGLIYENVLKADLKWLIPKYHNLKGDANQGIEAISYGNLVFYLTLALKEANQKINNLESRLSKLEALFYKTT